MTQIFVLGSGTPEPTPERFGSSFVVETGGEHLMFDCGPAATHKLVKAGLATGDIARLFFTHHHYDHNVDYPCLLLNRWAMGNGEESTLQVYGPQPTTRMTEQLIGEDGVFWGDIQARMYVPGSQQIFVNRGGTLPKLPPEVATHDIDPGYTLSGNGWDLHTGWADHAQPWLDSITYRLETESGTIVFTGDTKPCDEVVELAQDADVLMCMCWDDQDRLNEDLKGKPAMCGTRDAAAMAQRAGVKHLVLIHSKSEMDSPESRKKTNADISEIFDGGLTLAYEGLKLDLEDGRLSTEDT